MKKLLLPSILLAALFVVACTRFDEPVMVQETENERSVPRTRSGGASQTFNILPNPYALDVMQKNLEV